jgi:hypothetical protein
VIKIIIIIIIIIIILHLEPSQNRSENASIIYRESMKSRNYRKQPYWALHTYCGKYKCKSTNILDEHSNIKSTIHFSVQPVRPHFQFHYTGWNITPEFLCPIQGQYGALRFDYSVHTRLDYPIGS